MKKRSASVLTCGAGLLLVGLLASCHDGGDGLVHSKVCTETFTACGGDPEGTWEIVDVCIDGNIADAYNKEEAPTCSGLYESVTLAGAGTAFYNGLGFAHHGQAQETAIANYSPSCAQAAEGIAPLNADTCHELEFANSDAKIGKVARCKFKEGTCRCTETTTVEVDSSGAYGVTRSSRIVEEDSAYDFCINGDTMVQREQFHGDAYVVTTLKKR